MKVLLWGIYSPWTLNFVTNFLLTNNYEVWILNKGDKQESKKYIEIYNKTGIHLIKFPDIVTETCNRRDGISSLYTRYLMLKTLIKVGPFDIINMQYVNYSDLIDVIILKIILKARLILSYWGSDLLRIEDKKLKSAGKFLKYADFMTFDNIDLELKFKRTYRWSNMIPQKTVMFGLPVLDSIRKILKDNDREAIRKKWGIDEGKIVIAIGYNGIPEQQHKKVLGILGKLDDDYKKKIVLLLQMSYGGDRTYRNSVIIAVKKTGFQYINIQHFLTDDEVAEIRILTDIYINAQTTDAFSGSVCEYLFAGTVLINAKWLRYKELEKYNFTYLEFENFNDINEIVKKILKEEVDLEGNKTLIWKLRSWESCAPKWDKIYKRMCNHAEDSCNFGWRKRDKTPSIYGSNTKTSGSYSR